MNARRGENKEYTAATRKTILTQIIKNPLVSASTLSLLIPFYPFSSLHIPSHSHPSTSHTRTRGAALAFRRLACRAHAARLVGQHGLVKLCVAADDVAQMREVHRKNMRMSTRLFFHFLPEANTNDIRPKYGSWVWWQTA
jgi:hypothetical protein